LKNCLFLFVGFVKLKRKTRKMNKLFAKLGLALVMGVIFTASLNSCRKEAPTVAKIRIIDTSGTALPEVRVRLYATPTIDEHGALVIDDTLFTDIEGFATFDYTDMFNLGQAGFAVLDIEANSGDTLYGEGIIKIEQEETSEETVVVQ
jgi:hypothetical protein